MAKKGARQLLAFVCQVCKRQNYITEKNKINTEGKMAIAKYCKWCKKHTEHKETMKLD